MTRVPPSAVLNLFMLSLLSIANAQMPQPLNDNPGKDCLEYNLDVVTLKDNNHKIYWKEHDCIRVNVVNNPFIYIYTLKFDEQKIAEDDVLGSLGSLFGLKTISSANPTAPKTAASSGGKNLLLPSETVKGRQALALAKPKQCDSNQERDLKSLYSSVSQLASRIHSAESSLDDLKNAPKDLGTKLDQKEKTYEKFQQDYFADRKLLIDAATDAATLKSEAYKLQADSLTVSNTLTGDTAFESEIVNKFESARVSYNDFSRLAKDAVNLQLEADHASACIPQKKGDPDQSVLQEETSDLKSQTDGDAGKVQIYASQIANVACRYKARKDGEFSWIYDQVYLPITAVLANPVAFGYSTVKREGPFSDPTEVSVTLTRDVIVDKSSSLIPKQDDSVLECDSDPSKILQSSTPFATLAELPVSQPKSKMAPDKTITGKQTQTAPGPIATQQASTVVLEQPWSFGKARLVLSGGLSTAFLRKQEFQRSSSINGTTSQTVIGLKTNTPFRVTPMLYGHTLLGSTRHDSDAWYATFGVTANSDNKGTSPEFLLGFSRSFAQQKFFATLGAYIGERQKLDGGLYVGEVIPSTLTTDLPVTKSYRVGFAIGLSYRFASSKAPQSNNSNQTKQQNNSGSQKKTSN